MMSASALENLWVGHGPWTHTLPNSGGKRQTGCLGALLSSEQQLERVSLPGVMFPQQSGPCEIPLRRELGVSPLPLSNSPFIVLLSPFLTSYCLSPPLTSVLRAHPVVS